jgi:type II secretory pathway pseudopilin PulG
MYPHPGISRLKAIIVLAVVGLLVGIVIPTIQKVREASSRMQCSNNLKQLGLGLQNYDSAYGRLPMLTDQGKGARTGHGLPSIFFSLMPYLEAHPRFYDPDDSPPARYHDPSTTIHTAPMKFVGSATVTHQGGAANQFNWRTFIDPTDTTAHELRDIPMTLPDGSTGYYATGSYAVNGQLPCGKGSISKLPANTILFAERPQVCKTASGETIYNLWGVGFYSPHMPAFAALAPLDSPESWNTGQIAPVRPLPGEENASQIRVRIGREDAVPQSQDFRRPFQRIYNDEPCDPRLPGTPHRSGMLCAMADGSVRVFSHSTTPWVFWSACVPAEEGK